MQVVINILTFLVFTNIAFFFMYPIYLSAEQISKTAIGFIMGIFFVASFLARPFVGKAVDRVGEKPVLVVGLLVIFVCSLLYHLVQGETNLIYLLRIVHGLGYSAFVVAAFSALSKFTPRETLGRAFSYNGATILAALGFVPLAGERLMDAFGHPAIFHGGAGATFLGFTLVALTRKWEKVPTEGKRKTSYRAILRNRSFFSILMAMMLFVDAQATVLTYFPLYAKSIGLNGGLYMSLSLGLAVAIRIFGGGVLDRYSRLWAIRISFVLMGAGVMLIYRLDSILLYAVSVVLYGTGLGYIFPALNAIGAQQGSVEERPGIMSMLTMVMDAGFILGIVFSGGLSDMIGLSNTFLFAGSVALVGAVLTSLAPIREPGR